jgi:hypothetical protein
MGRRPPIEYTEIDYHGRRMTPVQYVADDLITLLPPDYARRLHRQGTVDILSEAEWHEIQETKGGALNVDAAYL